MEPNGRHYAQEEAKIYVINQLRKRIGFAILTFSRAKLQLFSATTNNQAYFKLRPVGIVFTITP